MTASFKKFVLTAFVALGLISSAQGIVIVPATVPVIIGPSGDTANKDAAAISAILGITVLELYKQDVGASDSGPFASSYTTTFSNIPSDPSEALIDYISGPFIGANPIYLFVKDGNANPPWYLFTITGWNGTDDLSLLGFWPGNGAISHIAIYGTTTTPGGGVPDGGTTALLLGLGLVSLAATRRFLSR